MLVGHSFGTFTVRLYASNYPAEVAGIVLVDPIHPSDWLEFFDAIVSQAESLPRSAAHVAATGAYGDIPLVVLSASGLCPSRVREHEALANLSSQGKHIVASKSGHWIQLDEPDLVVESVHRRPQ